MSGELNFEAMHFEGHDGFRTLAAEQSGFELEEELGRRARSQLRRQGFAPRAPQAMPKRLGRSPRFPPAKPKKPPIPPRRFPPFPPPWPWGVVAGAILRNIVMPELARGRALPSPATKISDREVAATLAMAAKKVPGLGITIEELLVRHQAEAGGIPVEVLLAFIHYEAGRLFDDATAGKWNEKYKRYIPSFYELGLFQTPAGDHGCVNEAGVKRCKYRPPGRNVENSQFGKGWRRIAGTYPTESDWKDPTMQVRVGLWDLTSTAENVRRDFASLFPSKKTKWFLRMAVLYSFAAGARAARAFLRKYKNELLALPEEKRWDFLRGKKVGTFYLNPENVDKKMALAAKLRAARRATVTQTLWGMP